MLSSLFASTLLFAASTNAQFPNCKNGTLVDKNPSFETGVAPWALSGGAVRTRATDGSFHPTNGKYYIEFESSKAKPSSALTQDLGGIDYYNANLSFDWQYVLSVTSRGPPETKCSLTVLFGGEQIFGWVRSGGNGGTGRVQESFGVNTGGNLTFTFGCTDLSDSFVANAAVDNVRFTKICG